MVNDVASNREDDAMWKLIAETGAGYVLMHMHGTPQTMQDKPVYKDVVGEVREFFVERMEKLRAAGVKWEQIVLDVGIGFGKTAEHNLQLLAGLRSFTSLERPIVLGVSRKSFIAKIADGGNGRLAGALACTTLAATAGVDIFRTHDVAETVQTLRMTEAILAKI